MKRVIILGSIETDGKNDPAIFADKLRRSGLDVQVLYWEYLVFNISTEHCVILSDGQDILDFQPDLVIALNWYKTGKNSYYRDVAYSVALYLDHHKVQFWNSEMIHQRSTSKLSCLLELALSGVEVTATTFSLSSAKLLELPFKFPLVVKSFAASRGKNNYLVSSIEELKSIISEDNNTYLVQPFIENDHDLRIICADGVPVLCLRRARDKRAQTHLNNTSQGANSQWLDLGSLPSELLTESQKVCNILNRELAGIDFILDSSSPCLYRCLEVNAIPQLTSGVDVDKKLDAIANAIMSK
jgi:glutathione synthase/RimK-type ligase-like ATP-grasp enzyme